MLPNDINFVLSGGENNSDPLHALGGNPSSHPISTTKLNNIFDDLSDAQTASGYQDYRCIYIFNESETETLYQSRVWIQYQNPGGSNITIGALSSNERQTISIGGTPTGAFLQLNYKLSTYNVSPSTNGNDIAADIQAWMTSLDPNAGIIVFATPNASFYDFVIAWNDHRYHSLMSVTATWTGTTYSVTRQSGGGPINSIAQTINTPTTPPSNITFISSSASNPISLGNLLPSDGVPIWICRTVTPTADPTSLDGFRLRFGGTLIAS